MKRSSQKCSLRLWLAAIGVLFMLWTISPLTIKAQTNTFPASGNVGIRTDTPTTKLHVSGGSRVDGPNGRIYLGTTAATGARGLEFIEENATTYSIRHHDPYVAWQNIALSPYGGNVGVGTATPSRKLHVMGGNVFHQFSATAGQEYGFYTSIQNNHLTSNVYFDGQWKMMTAGKGFYCDGPTQWRGLHPLCGRHLSRRQCPGVVQYAHARKHGR